MGIRGQSPSHPFRGTRAISRPLCALLLLGLLGLPIFRANRAFSQNRPPTQDDVEAAYLYNFGRFVQWPLPTAQKSMNICVLGQDPFGGTLDRIVAKEQVNGLRLAVVRLQDTRTAGSCAILFMGASEASHLDRDLSALDGLPVLTVSDLPGFIDRGGMIQFVLENDSVRFEVNLTAAENAGLTLSSQLLKVAVRVFRKQPGRAAQ